MSMPPSPSFAPSPSLEAIADSAANLMTDFFPAVPLLPQTRPTTDSLASSWMGDIGFQDEHVGAWRRAETQFDLKNVPPKTPKHKEPLGAKDDMDKKFRAEKNFKGKFLGSRSGFIYRKGDDDMVGYYPDNPPTPVKPIIRVCIHSFLDAISLLPYFPPQATDLQQPSPTAPAQR